MTNKEATAIALKCFAVYVLGRVLLALPSYAAIGRMLNNSKDGGPSAVWAVIVSPLSVIIGILNSLPHLENRQLSYEPRNFFC